MARKLRPGLQLEQVDGMLAEVPQPVPQELRILYSWHDGTDYAVGAYRAEIYRGGMFLPLAEALANRSGGLSGAKEAWDERWVPVFMDEHFAFDAVVCGLEGGAVVSFSYLDLPQFAVEYRSLGDLVRSLITRWETGVYRIDETGGVVLDPRSLAALRRQEDGDDPDVTGLVQALRVGGEKDWLDALSRLRTRLYPSAVPSLIALLEDHAASRHWYAVELLGSIGDPSALPALVRAATEDADENVRKYAEITVRDWA